MPHTYRKPAYALATILVLLSVALFGVGALITISTLDSKISRSQKEGVSAYYVAEAGVQDAVWRISNNQSSYSDKLQQGTLNATYSSASNVPEPGQSYTVTLSQGPQGAGYGIIDVYGYSDNGSFVAQRHVQDKVFQGASASPSGTNALLSGSGFSADTNGSTITVSGGDLYATQSISVNQNGNSGSVNLGTNRLMSAGSSVSPSSCSGRITCGGVVKNAPAIAFPGFDFGTATAGNAYSIALANGACYGGAGSCNKTIAQFNTALTTNTLPASPVVYVNGNVSFSSNTYKNVTAAYAGMLVIAGSLSSSANNFNLTINDPGTGKAGLFVRDNVNITATTGSLTVNGAVYTSQALSMTGNQQWTVNGGILSAGTVNMQPGVKLALTYNSDRVSASLGGGTPSVVQGQHWEEEY